MQTKPTSPITTRALISTLPKTQPGATRVTRATHCSQATDTTIIDDTQFRFPVVTEALRAWEASYGKLTARNYEQFCADVPCGLPDVQVGTAEMIDVCAALLESGAAYRLV